MKKHLFLVTLLLFGVQAAWADPPLLSFRISDDPNLKLEGTTTTNSGRVFFQDGRSCNRCTVTSIGGFVVAITDKAGNKWPLTPGIVQVDAHPIRSAYADAMRQYNSIYIQQANPYGAYSNPALQMMRWQQNAQPAPTAPSNPVTPQN